MSLQAYYDSLSPEEQALQFGLSGGDPLGHAFPRKRVVHAGLSGKIIAPAESQQIWQDVMELANRPGTFTHGLGLHVTGIGDGWAEGELPAGDGMLNPLGIVHGGVYAAMMDHVAGTAACSRGSTCRTVNYDLHYLAPAQPGLLRCRAESVRMGSRSW